MSEITIRKSIVERYIQDFASRIHHMDGKQLPAVMLELQAEEALIQNIDDHKTITNFSKQTLEKVFRCWFGSSDGLKWYDKMFKEEKLERGDVPWYRLLFRF